MEPNGCSLVQAAATVSKLGSYRGLCAKRTIDLLDMETLQFKSDTSLIYTRGNTYTLFLGGSFIVLVGFPCFSKFSLYTKKE